MIDAEPADWLAGMTELGPVAWPPEPIRTERLVLRESEARDRAAFLELLTSPEVNTYLGGPQPRDKLERELPEVPERWPGSFVVERNGAMIGQVLLRRTTEHRRPAAVGKADLGYLFLPRAWGFGYAAEACAAALDWLDSVLPGEPVVLTTQSANVGSMRLAAKLGFTEVERFRAWDAEQWLGLRPSAYATIEAAWQAVREDSSVRTELSEAAYAEPRLRRLLPWTGMSELHFSRCTEWPWTWDIPYIQPADGQGYLIAGPSRSETVGPAATAREAVAMVVERLPVGSDAVFVGRPDQLAAREARLSREAAG